MATYTNKILYRGIISGSLTVPKVLYTCSAATTTIVSSIRVTNVSSSLADYCTFRMYITPISRSGLTNDAIHYDTEVRAKTGFTDMSAYVMTSGSTLQAYSTTPSGAAAYISGVEIT